MAVGAEVDKRERTRDQASGARWTSVLLPWLVSQVIAGAALLGSRSFAFDDRLRFSPFTIRWDGGYYLGIASSGYGPVNVLFPRWAFFPGLPAVIRGLGDLGIDERIGIHVVNQVALLVAMIAIHRLALRRGTSTAALLAVWAFALFPAAFVFSMTYPSALFVAAIAWAFLLVEDRHDVAAGLLAAGATLLRPTGIVVGVALLVAVWGPGRAYIRRAVVLIGPSAVALVVWCIYCQDRIGDALVWVTTKSKWQEISIVDAMTGDLKLSLLPHVPLAILAIAVVVMQRKRLPVAWLALTGLLILPAFVTGMVGLGRYSVECFPPFIAAGQLMERWSAHQRVAVFVAGGAGMAVFAFVVGRYALVP